VRVALVTKIFPSSIQQWGGHSAYETIRLLAQRCDLQAFYPYLVFPQLLGSFDRTPRPDPAWQPEGVKVSYIPHAGIPGLTRHLNGSIIARTVLPYVRRFNPDIVLSYFIYPYGYASVRVAQALGNLIANAFEHGGGRPVLRGVRRGNAVRIEVEDRGRGLAIAQRAAEDAGGRLQLTSTRAGTVAAVELPVADE